MAKLADLVSRPVSDSNPAGPDLFDEMDEAYDAAVLDVEDMLPASFLTMWAGMGQTSGTDGVPSRLIFDSETLNVPDRIQALDALLLRTRDIRPVALRIRLAFLATDIAGALEGIEALVAILESHPTTCHPTDGRERSDALDTLSNAETTVWPLRFTSLGKSRVTHRMAQVVRNEVSPLILQQRQAENSSLKIIADETTYSSDDIEARIEALSADGASPRDGALLSESLDAVKKLEDLCKADPLVSGSVSFRDLRTQLSEMLALFGTEAETEVHNEPEEGGADTGTTMGLSIEVTSHDHARGALAACEVYMHRTQPASGCLLMLTLGRQLVGQSLLEAIKKLAPERQSNIRLFLPPTSAAALFTPQLEKLTLAVQEAHEITQQQAEPAASLDSSTEPHDDATERSSVSAHPPIPEIDSAQEVIGIMRSVEAWISKQDPTSPVPLVLAQGREYLGKDFKEMFGKFVVDN